MNRKQLRQDLIRDEGWRRHVYRDTLGFLTVGFGFVVDERRGAGVPRHIAEQWLDYLITKVVDDLHGRLPWLKQQPEEVQRALANQAYQLGVSGLLNFKKMLAALQDGDRETAAREALDSLYAKQTPARAQRVAALIRGSRIKNTHSLGGNTQ